MSESGKNSANAIHPSRNGICRPPNTEQAHGMSRGLACETRFRQGGFTVLRLMAIGSFRRRLVRARRGWFADVVFMTRRIRSSLLSHTSHDGGGSSIS